MQLSFPCLCLVTDRNQCNGRRLEDVVDRAIEGGVNLVQLREKDLSARELLELANRLKEVTTGRASLFINDRLDVALSCNADGVQLGEDGLPLEAARELSNGRLLLSRSVHSVEGAIDAEKQGADLLIVGTIFPTGSHPGVEASGVQILKGVRDSMKIPFLAIGGVNSQNANSVIQAGAYGCAVISAITRSYDPEGAARSLIESMQQAWASTPNAR